MKSNLQLLIEANSVLRSCYQVAARGGKDTSWPGLTTKIETALNEQHKRIYNGTKPSPEDILNKYGSDKYNVTRQDAISAMVEWLDEKPINQVTKETGFTNPTFEQDYYPNDRREDDKLWEQLLIDVNELNRMEENRMEYNIKLLSYKWDLIKKKDNWDNF
jgi:hypothetical protein